MHDLHHIYPFTPTCCTTTHSYPTKNPMPIALSLQLFSNNKDCVLVAQSSLTLCNNTGVTGGKMEALTQKCSHFPSKVKGELEVLLVQGGRNERRLMKEIK